MLHYIIIYYIRLCCGRTYLPVRCGVARAGGVAPVVAQVLLTDGGENP